PPTRSDASLTASRRRTRGDLKVLSVSALPGWQPDQGNNAKYGNRLPRTVTGSDPAQRPQSPPPPPRPLLFPRDASRSKTERASRFAATLKETPPGRGLG